MTVSPVPVGTHLVDTDTIITPLTAAMLHAQGVAGVIRYLSRTIPNQRGDLSADEIAGIHRNDLGLFVVQHVAPAGRWMPSRYLGTAYGTAAVSNAYCCGLPSGATVALDLETPAANASAADTIAYVNAWTQQVAAGSYEPMLYVGPGVPLSGEDLFWRLAVKLYWRSAARVPDVPHRGYAMAQSLPRMMAGITVDQNVVTGDTMGGVPHWWVRE